jgi:predicted AAA+ superfamily ATPase
LGHPHRKPLLVRGARQVGKSTLVRLFAQEAGLKLVEVNLERHRELATVFARQSPRQILDEISLGLDVERPVAGKSLLFLDEIQALPDAIQSLRYFHEELPELAVIAAGSLLEHTLGSSGFSMPVGRVDHLWLGPMHFGEFLEACGEPQLALALRSVPALEEWSSVAHLRLAEKLREYLLVGGMPEAVLAFSETRDLTEVRKIHHSLLQTYRDDFHKYASGAEFSLLQRTLDYAGQGVGRKIKYNQISRDHRSAQVRDALELLEKSQVLTKVHHSAAAGLPLGAQRDDNIFKLLSLDVGLVSALAGIQALPLEQLSTSEFVGKGALAEQFVGQHLAYAGPSYQRPELFYWLREGKGGNAEVDLLLPHGGAIYPVEIKAGKSGSLKSLHQFCLLREPPLAIRFDLNPPSLQHVEVEVLTATGSQPLKFRLLSLPLYLAEELPRWIEALA